MTIYEQNIVIIVGIGQFLSYLLFRFLWIAIVFGYDQRRLTDIAHKQRRWRNVFRLLLDVSLIGCDCLFAIEL